MPAPSIPLINGVAYSYVDVIVEIAGVPAPSVSKISYSEEQAKENNFGTGGRPVSRGKGKIEPMAFVLNTCPPCQSFPFRVHPCN